MTSSSIPMADCACCFHLIRGANDPFFSYAQCLQAPFSYSFAWASLHPLCPHTLVQSLERKLLFLGMQRLPEEVLDLVSMVHILGCIKTFTGLFVSP